jgi:hypothetical protein
MRKLPITTKIDTIDVKPVARQPLFSLYDQTIRTLKREKGAEKLANFFAEPNVSKTDNEIRWRTLATGPIRSWAELSEQEQQRAGEQLKENCSLLQEICQRLTKAQGADSPTVEALQNMQVTPSLQNSLFMVGDEVVLTQWGCRPFGTQPVDFNLEGQGKELAKKIVRPAAVVPPVIEPFTKEPEFIPPPPPPPSPPEDPPVVVPPPDEPPAPEEKKPEEKKPLLWRWLVLLLLLLLLLIGLFLKKWTYVAPYDTAAEDRYRAEIAELWQKIDDKSKQCVPKKAEPAPNLNSEAMERGDLNVFNGTWRLITELHNAKTKERITIELAFGGSGQGVATVTEATGAVCQGSASLKINSANSFDVNTSALACKPNTTGGYSPNFVQCNVKKDRRTADCVLQCVDGKCDATFQRK